MSNSSPIVEAEVIDYLKDHPDFFNKHLDLLGSLDIPHQSGKAVSLVERQMQALRQSNSDLKERLEQLLDVARNNEKHFDNTKTFTIDLVDFHLDSGNLKKLIELFNQRFPSILAAHDYRLVLIDQNSNTVNDKVVHLDRQQLKEEASKLADLKKALCGTLKDQEKALLFGDAANKVNSFAVIPLRSGELFGLIAIGNRQEHYFQKSMGTLFLDYIGELAEKVIFDILEKDEASPIAV